MFSFNFDVSAEDLSDSESQSLHDLSEPLHSLSINPIASTSNLIPSSSIPLTGLIDTLPNSLSYIPQPIPGSSTTLLRRELFDARFQLLSEASIHDDGSSSSSESRVGTANNENELEFVDESSDLIKGLYEGGLKVWECSIDLCTVLEKRNDRFRGKNVVELGCGTALPACFVFARLLAEIREEGTRPTSDENDRPGTRIVLQDYNKQVLSLITLPNLILTYAHHLTLSSSSSFAPITTSSKPSHQTDSNSNWLTQPGELDLSEELITSFLEFLSTEKISLNFIQGSWSDFPCSTSCDLILTSETIYEPTSLPSLISILENSKGATQFVACKKIYFGVGGGENEFRHSVLEKGGKVDRVWEEDKGVGRIVLKVEW